MHYRCKEQFCLSFSFHRACRTFLHLWETSNQNPIDCFSCCPGLPFLEGKEGKEIGTEGGENLVDSRLTQLEMCLQCQLAIITQQEWQGNIVWGSILLSQHTYSYGRLVIANSSTLESSKLVPTMMLAPPLHISISIWVGFCTWPCPGYAELEFKSVCRCICICFLILDLRLQ